MRTKSSPIAVEGFPFIAVAGGLTALAVFLGWYALAAIFLIITLFIVYFFRNPPRQAPAVADSVIAPADGVVIYLGPAFESHLQAEVTKISIFMSVFNVHVNRFPVAGRVIDSFYTRGKFLDVRHERATFENEQQGLILETGKGIRLVCVQVAGLVARRIICYLKPGDSLAQGEIYGLIRFGSRLDVYLPAETDIRVALGEKTKAGETILGILP